VAHFGGAIRVARRLATGDQKKRLGTVLASCISFGGSAMPANDPKPGGAAVAKSDVDLERLVAEADTGGRRLTGLAAQVLLWTAVAWSLFQLWYASPLPFVVRLGVFNDTEARSIHLAFALFLAFSAYPAFASSRRERLPWIDIAFALA
jgi:hypothetical protein